MKTLLLIRHAKSDWSDSSQSDFDRPLNERGKKDAPKMAQRLWQRDLKIDLFISSPAKRARKTAEEFVKVYGNKKEVQLKSALYLAASDTFYSIIEQADPRADTIAVFSHNPGITEFANSLTTARIDNIPTCGVFAVSIDTDRWENFSSADKSFVFFDYPKGIID